MPATPVTCPTRAAVSAASRAARTPVTPAPTTLAANMAISAASDATRAPVATMPPANAALSAASVVASLRIRGPAREGGDVRAFGRDQSAGPTRGSNEGTRIRRLDRGEYTNPYESDHGQVTCEHHRRR